MENKWTGKPLPGLIKEHFSPLRIKDPYNICLPGFPTCYTSVTAVSPIFLQVIVIDVTMSTFCLCMLDVWGTNDLPF